MNFLTAVNHLIDKSEGGFVNHPSDKGKATNWGITQKVYELYKGRAVSLDEMKKMPKSDAIAIYKKEYWDKIMGDSIKSYAIAYSMFDQAVNGGVSSAVKMAQEVAGISIDGKMGPITLGAINGINETNFVTRFYALAEKRYRYLATNEGPNDKDQDFIEGWINRAKNIREYALSNVGKTAGIGGAIILTGLIFFLILQSPKQKA